MAITWGWKYRRADFFDAIFRDLGGLSMIGFL